MHQVLVGGNDTHAGIFGDGLDQRRDHIIRFEVLDLNERNSDRFEKFTHQGNLAGEIFGLGIPIRLVAFVEAMPKSSTSWIEGDNGPGGLFFPQQLREHIGKAQDRIGGRAVRRAKARRKRKK